MLKDKRPFELANRQWDSNCRKENFYFAKEINEISKQKNVSITKIVLNSIRKLQ